MRHDEFMPKFELGEKIDPKAPKEVEQSKLDLEHMPSLQFLDGAFVFLDEYSNTDIIELINAFYLE